jgi:hypothetical protein
MSVKRFSTSGDGALSRTFTYDALGRIASNSRLGSYAYPAAGQPKPYAPTQVGPYALTYDAAGNRLAGIGRSHTYDGESKLVWTSGAWIDRDPDGERVRKLAASGNVIYAGPDVEIAAGVMTKRVTPEVKRV